MKQMQFLRVDTKNHCVDANHIPFVQFPLKGDVCLDYIQTAVAVVNVQRREADIDSKTVRGLVKYSKKASRREVPARGPLSAYYGSKLGKHPSFLSSYRTIPPGLHPTCD
jgi:hypothetical protein